MNNKSYFPNLNKNCLYDLDFMNEDELFEWLH